MALTFSKMEGKRTIFTVEASKSTDFRGENASLLEDVKITIFGERGQRHDLLHTQSCRYSKEKGSISCAGVVQIDLLSAADAARTEGHPEKAADLAIHVETKGVTFDRVNGLAMTDQPVTFRFPNGKGRAIGVQYRSDEGTLRLERDVEVKLHPTVEQSKKEPRAPQEVEIQGAQLDFGRESHSVELLGPAIAKTESARLSAGRFDLLLDEDFRAKKLVARPDIASGTRPATAPAGRPEATIRARRGEQALTAELISASFSPDGWVEQIRAEGGVRGRSESSDTKSEWDAETAELALWPQVNLPKELDVRGNADLKTAAKAGDESRELRTDALRMLFSEPQKGKKAKQTIRLTATETLSPGTIFWTERDPNGKRGLLETKLKADKLALDFASSGKAKELKASGNVQTERRAEGKPVQTASGETGVVEFGTTGGWTQMQLDGGVRLKDGDRSALADHAVFMHAAQTATLTGHALARGASMQTTAGKITFSQGTGEIFAEHAVKSTELSIKSNAVGLAAAPANITADQLRANSKNGRAVYTGHARLWQGPSVLEADSIDLLREPRSLSASGSVRAIFPQTNAAEKGKPGEAKTKLWHVSAGKLTYLEKEDRAHLEKDVVIQSGNDRVQAAIVDLYFTRAAPAETPGNSPSARQISRAVATGGVVVEQGARRATAERGEYTAADGKFVMSGGNPTIFDSASGTTSGRQLTFFLADDTIIVDSEKGSRTLTKHRVE